MSTAQNSNELKDTHDRKAGLAHHRRRTRPGHRHREGRARRRSRGRRHRPQRRQRHRALGEHDDLLAVPLDVTDPAAAEAAVAAAVERFGHLDVLVNNAGSFNAGFFEEMTPEDFRAQIETTLFGPVNVTRAALPQMRAQRSGLVVTVSSTAGIASTGDFLTAYAASKFGVEGFMEALTTEVAPFGIKTMLVVPGFFRTELLSPQSTSYAEPSIDDYAERTRATVAGWQGMDGQQGGDPAKLADALVQLVALDEPPLRFAAGADAVAPLRDQGPDAPRPGGRPPRALQQPRRELTPHSWGGSVTTCPA